MDEIKVFSRTEYSLLKQIEKQIPERYGCTYILEYGKYVKIGCSSKPYKRLASLKSNAENYGDCQLGRIAILPCCRNFGVIEGFLHEKFSEYRKSGSELFSVSLETVLDEIAKYDIDYRSKIEIEIVQILKEEKNPENRSYATDIYNQRKIGELERRIEKLEAQLTAFITNPVNTGDYYTVPQMAKALNVSPLTVRRKIQSGQITAQKIGKYWKIPKTELDQIFD